jgi:hypothetical protein
LFKAYIAVFPQKQIIIIDPVTNYIETNKTKLFTAFNVVNTEKILDLNMNIDPVFYNKKDLDEKLVDQNNDLEKVWKTRILFENTPRGNIIMYYSVYKQGFAYYCDATGIPYPILNAVAMKYVTTFQCRDFFMDNEYLSEEKESPLIKLYLEQEKESKTEQPPVPKLDSSVFARLKDYNNNMVNEETSTSEMVIKPIEKEYNRNIFLNMGKVCNFSFIQKPEKKSKLNGFYSALLNGVDSEGRLQEEVMSYSRFKALSLKKMEKKEKGKE